MKQKKKSGFKKWGIAFVVLSVLQFGSMYGIDLFLKPPSLEAAMKKAGGAVAATATPVESRVSVPGTAVLSALTEDQRHVAYTTADNRLQIEDKTGIIFDQDVGDVTFMKWLEPSDTLIYFVKGKSTLTGYLIRAGANSEMKPVEVHQWSSKQREVEAVYFSPYLEFVYIEMNNGSYDEVYKYKASTGIHRLSLGNVVIDHIDYNPTEDKLVMTTDTGKVWTYEGDRLRRPDGSKVIEKDQQPATVEQKKSSSQPDEPRKTRAKKSDNAKNENTKSNEMNVKSVTEAQKSDKLNKSDKSKTEGQPPQEPSVNGTDNLAPVGPNDVKSEAK
ncbi:hypothetical protein DFP93_11353 [Aneurinibacillus soli]|uniref:Uncharacterized protein n=1 Tax=Aneurinibacillus soli TaxID=1500254 RepID=A0A0U4WEU4_9BACL|nr:hypothetical protein [Aneurinibacillus soli]PYE60344.1 hypothetical protein DFP93_11353 [Aneurinibacillus soli]BAU27256.1 hypothetical protein CB4_01425 [Aneurinibacillus soli]